MTSAADRSIEEVAEFREFFAANFREVERFCVRRVPAADADAIAGDAFLVAWRSWERRPVVPNEQRPWLFGIARNMIRASQRRERARPNRERLATRMTPPAADAFEVITLDVGLRSALAQLRPADRQLLLLVAWDECDMRELAAVLGISAGAARVRLHRARLRLQRILDPNQPVGATLKITPTSKGQQP